MVLDAHIDTTSSALNQILEGRELMSSGASAYVNIADDARVISTITTEINELLAMYSVSAAHLTLPQHVYTCSVIRWKVRFSKLS